MEDQRVPSKYRRVSAINLCWMFFFPAAGVLIGANAVVTRDIGDAQFGRG
jgi:hypothetical protein